MIWAFLAGLAVIPLLVVAVCLLEWLAVVLRVKVDTLLFVFAVAVAFPTAYVIAGWLTNAI